jgi:hypothetical protein
MYLDQDLVSIVIGTSRKLAYTSKNPPSTSSDENVANRSISTSCSTCSSVFVTLFSTYFSSSESLIMKNASASGATCFRKSLKVSSSPPIMATRINASKISCFTSLPSPKFSLLSQSARSGLDASDSMYIVLVALKTSSLTLYNYFSSAFYFFLTLSLLSFASLLLALSLN